ncbi:inosine 5'-monophosphate dehydrogenase [Mariprofundus micogutta]|uniref:Inosine 5'-monophosphate dehydrogenase n=1 Tax=Mariprofundus micogutta TaxID=1921010 RepID=A0A1L8CJZ8_9PROT|nr:CBS domain-containing protein [Mariprofundus micogutta]GAV19247.1 inosine 5'-monophosphate dehydrogenase [Mariprofundus micogutta]
MKVSEVMSRGSLTCKAGDTLHDATQKMVMRRCGSLPVVADDDENKLLGIITIRDTMLPLYPNFGEYIHDAKTARDFEDMEENYKRVMCMKVKEVMTPDPMTVESETPILKAASFMGLKNLRRIPVVDDGKLSGMVSIGDINRGMFIQHG